MRTFSALGDREENARNEGLAVVLLLEDGDLLPKTRSAVLSARPLEARRPGHLAGSGDGGGKKEGRSWGGIEGEGQLDDVRAGLLVGEGLERNRLDVHRDKLDAALAS